MTSRRAALFLIAILYLGAGACLAIDRFADLGKTTPPPGEEMPYAKWAQPLERDDPRPFWLRLLLSLRWDFHHRDIRGGTTF